MGRATWGTTNLGIQNKLYHSCYRAMSGHYYNSSMSNYIRSSVSPFLYFGNSGSTNSRMSTYVYNKGYVFGIKLVNDSPSYGTISVYRGSSAYVTGTSTNGGSTNSNNQFVSANHTYLNIRFAVAAGGQFNGWRSSANGGGSLITTSTNYNAYYTNADIYNRSVWYTYTEAGTSSESTTLGYGSPQFRACFFYNSAVVYYDDNYTAITSPGIYSNSDLSSGAPGNYYYSTGTIVRYWGGSSWSGPLQLCPF
tara:strand:+ start:958 stop:1710 length:753 start_codon:yes stop_codon:yes gene_type:complete